VIGVGVTLHVLEQPVGGGDDVLDLGAVFGLQQREGTPRADPSTPDAMTCLVQGKDPPDASALFISSIDTTRFAMPNMPLRSVTDLFAATTRYCPGSSWTNSTTITGADVQRLTDGCWNRDPAFAGDGCGCHRRIFPSWGDVFPYFEARQSNKQAKRISRILGNVGAH